MYGGNCDMSPPLQAEYEVTPDVERRERGQEVVQKFFNPQVSSADGGGAGREVHSVAWTEHPCSCYAVM